jgi:hypothetical protein
MCSCGHMSLLAKWVIHIYGWQCNVCLGQPALSGCTPLLTRHSARILSSSPLALDWSGLFDFPYLSLCLFRLFGVRLLIARRKLAIGAVLMSGSLGIFAAVLRTALVGRSSSWIGTLLANVEMVRFHSFRSLIPYGLKETDFKVKLTVNIAVNTPAIRSLVSDSKWSSSFSGRSGRSGYANQGYELNEGPKVHTSRHSTQNKFLNRNKPADSLKSDSEVRIVRADNWSKSSTAGEGVSDIKSLFDIRATVVYNASEEQEDPRRDDDKPRWTAV